MKLKLSDEDTELLIKALQHVINLKFSRTPRLRILQKHILHSYHLSKAHRGKERKIKTT